MPIDSIGKAVETIGGPGTKPYIIVGKAVVDLAAALQPVIGEAADRPIGMNTSTKEFSPKALGLNLEKAKRLSQQDNGLGPGVIEVNYQDGGDGGGSYTLYLQVEVL